MQYFCARTKFSISNKQARNQNVYPELDPALNFLIVLEYSLDYNYTKQDINNVILIFISVLTIIVFLSLAVITIYVYKHKFSITEDIHPDISINEETLI